MSAPLEGLRILVTRPEPSKADKWAVALSAAGATVVPYPTIEVMPPPSWEALDSAIRRIERYHWIIFTSQSAVRFTVARLPGGRFPAGWSGPRLAAVGAETALALEEVGGRVDLVPADQRQEGLIEAFRDLQPGACLLFPHAFSGRDTLIGILRSQGCQVDVVAAYQTGARSGLPPAPAFDVATFASPSALRAFVEKNGTGGLTRKIVAVIGPTTAAEAIAHHLSPVVAAHPNIDALISAIVRVSSPKGVP
jgi:uroporphyrinogen-III synthase